MSTAEWLEGGEAETGVSRQRRRRQGPDDTLERLFPGMFPSSPEPAPLVKAESEQKPERPKPKALPDVSHDRAATGQDQSCSVCLENVVAIMLRPCCHAQLCRTCYVALRKRESTVQCPSCRATSTDFDVIYL